MLESKRKIEIIFENEDLVVVDKPAMVLSVPPRFADDRPVVGRLLEEQLKRQLYPVHRLDYEVSGVLLFAKTPQAQKSLSRSFEAREVKKTYMAVCEIQQKPPQTRATWKNKLVRGKKRTFEAEYGDEAVTEAEVMEVKGDRAYMLLMPLTGRSHQLRVHCAKYIGPICGDRLYGAQSTWTEGIALRAVELEIPSYLKSRSNLVFKVASLTG